VVYLRTRQEYLEQGFAILDAASKILANDPQATYLVESPYLLEQWFAIHPGAQADFRLFAEEDRLDVAPGMYVMPDMAMPGAESLNLQVERGFHWCEDALGLRPTVCWIPDPWNHPPTLPQWLNKCGYTAYVFSRGADPGHPNHFRWRGLDGSETLGVRMPLHYDRFTPALAAESDSDRRFTDYLNRLDALFPPGQPILVPVGGDFAAPTPQTAELLARMRGRGTNIAFSTLPRFVQALRAHWSELPVMPSDFTPTFQGTYSSRIALKRANRQVETAVDTLRRFEAAGGRPQGEWQDVLAIALRHQFHDTISGTIIDPANDEAVADYARIIATLQEALPTGTRRAGRTVFNPSAEARTECVFLKDWSAPGAQDESGTPVPVQRVDGGAVARLTVGPMGTTTITSAASSEPLSGGASATDRAIENSHIRVELDDLGNISQVVLKGRAAEMRLLSGDRPLFNTLSLEHDYGDFWVVGRQPLDGGHVGRTPYVDPLPLARDPAKPWVDSRGSLSDCGRKHVEVLEEGPLRARVRVIGSVGLQRWRVDFEQTITLHAGSPRIDFRTVVKPAAKFARLRAVFRPALGHAEALYHVPYGLVGRDANEHAAQNGVALNGAHAGLLLLNRGIPGNGWDGEALTLSLLRCVAMEYKGPSETGYEAGATHLFEYAVVPYRPAGRPDLCRKGDRFNLPLIEAPEPLAGLPFEILHPDNVQVTRIERVPGGYRVHAHESLGKEGYIRIEVAGGWVGPVDVLGVLTDEPKPELFDRELHPFEIVMIGIVHGDE
jgi:alpha-mannosidase